MYVGLQIPSFKCPGGAAAIRSRLKEVVTRAEEAGFYSFWVMDHFYQIEGLFGETYTDPMMECYTTLGYLAGLTERAYLGVLVTGVIYRYPSILLKTVNTLDILSGGRAYFGIGAAWYEQEARGFGVPFPALAERFTLLEETLRLAKTLWASDQASFEGKHVVAPAITNNPRPLSQPHPRILVGGSGPKKTMRLVAQYADACNISERFGRERMQQTLDALKRHCESVGRDYATIEKTSLSTVHLAGGDTAAGVLERLRELAAMGFTHAIVNLPDLYELRSLEVFAREIIPAAAEL
ncbi:TIGR03560 family F420-dependent LLM class oxidoreductase [Thermogemmatispora tikiterensis]|uniref:LLM class F420-dependent oxidoreductase n=1 Tax=Thermogemmatispora tikiterensis TaxID=1825093 RepID=A0A328VT02_9CHLR|nr:TIGR03560 family F420-dependent LLM class oxidoreductase [Thermogemmatispora tikiterensis]RAQ98414.1 LLM class F420-dependent oxidoreductase [Thermogemmatispora tikiterensis]